MSTRLDPEEALAGPLYLVAALLIVGPAADFLLSVPAAQPSSVQWRFAAAGLLSGHLMTPVLGLALAFVVAGVLRHYAVQRVLVVLCLTTAVVLVVVCIAFLLDVAQVRASVPTDGRPAFASAWKRAIIKHVLSAVALGSLGWRGRRMIPSPSARRTPKPVHVVSK